MERRLTAILAFDAAGYSRLMALDESGTLERFQALLDRIIRPAVERHRGHLVKLMGDGGLVEFASALEALDCAIEIQEKCARHQRDAAPDSRIRFRIGINVGDVIAEGGDIYGDGVNLAARLEGIADPGGIAVSRTVYEYTRGKVKAGFTPLGAQQLKNIPEPVEVFSLNMSGAPPPRRARRRAVGGRRRLLPLAGALVAAAALAGAAAVWLEQQGRIPPFSGLPLAGSTKPSLAVLPFENLSGTPNDDYFADGLTDDLITDLAKISGLAVIARNTVFNYKERPGNIQDVASDLGVRYVLEGSVRRAGERIRINAQLVDSRSGSHLWTDRIERSSADVFAAQDQVIAQIVDALALRLTPAEQQQIERLPTTNLEAYDFYLRGEQAAYSGFRPALRRALALFSRATQLDPGFAEAYAADARTAANVMRANYDDVLPRAVARERAYEKAGKALAIDPNSAQSFAVLAVLQSVDGRHEEALQSARRAVALAPGKADAQASLGLVLAFGGAHGEAARAMAAAERLNPVLPVRDAITAGLVYILNGQAEEAVRVLEDANARNPQVDDLLAMQAAAHAAAGQMEEAREDAGRAVRVGPNISVELYRLNLGNMRRSEDLERILQLMAEGGLQKWPFAFRPGSRPQLSGTDIESVSIGRVWHGMMDGVGPAILQISSERSMAVRSTDFFATGRAMVEGDSLCMRYENQSASRMACGPVYKGPVEHQGQSFEYTFVSAEMVFHFTPAN